MAHGWNRALATAALCGLSAPALAATHCDKDAVAALGVAKATIVSATPKAAQGPFPAYCDILAQVATDGEGAGPGSARLEVRLPETWNHKLVFFGVGGLAGSLDPSANPSDFVAALGRGYATAITDTGHVGNSPFDASWVLNGPGKPNAAAIADYFYRAPHETGFAAKALAAAFFAQPKVSRAYFDGCSFGGHMALMEAMRYPDDYDGVIAGAPYMDNRTQLWGYKNAKAFLKAYVTPQTVAKVNAAVLAACDAADGVKDGLIQNPIACNFDPQALVPGTLTQAQADAFKVFAAPVRDAQGHAIYPGSPLADLTATDGPAGGFVGWVTTPKPPADPKAAEPWGAAPPVLWAAAEGFTKTIDLADPAFDMNNRWPERDGQIAAEALKRFDARMAEGQADQPDKLAAFIKQGKKIIMYHGFGDPAISPYRTVWFYEDLAKLNGGYAKTQQSVRLFMAPGVSHCFGGDGPDTFDTLSALDAWVETGKAPESLIAAKFADTTPGAKPLRTMPLCPFPAKASFTGGDVKAAANWKCDKQDAAMLGVGSAGLAAGMGAGRK